MGSEGFYNSQFVQTLSTPTIVSTSASPSSSLTPPPTVDPATTIKMEDLNMPYSTPAPPSLPPTSECGTPTPQSSSDGKPVKKRKSWGQVLPEPKTNLPPRKRAKTEDEKEQRRIERVKRNRLAAHNSRERKRQEVEQLQSEKDKLEADLQAAHDTMARMAAELKAYRQKYPSESFSSSAATDDYESLVHKTDTVDPTHTSMSFPSPISMDSMDSPSPRDESCQPETPFSEANADFDQTRYPAAILCDLQCQSISASASRQPSLQAMLAFLSLFNLTLPLMRSLLTTFSPLTCSPRTAPMVWEILKTFSLLPASELPQTLTAFLTLLKASTSTCRQPLAQLSLATRLSQRSTSFKSVARSAGSMKRARQDGTQQRRRWRSPQLRQMGRRKGSSSFSFEREIHKSLLGSSGRGWQNHDFDWVSRRRTVES